MGISKQPSASASVKSAIALAGGMEIKEGSFVLVKPNVNSDGPHPATTNPEVLAAVIDAVLEHRPGRLIVGDRSVYWGNTMEYMNATGIFDAARKAEVINFEDEGWTEVNPAGAKSWHEGFSIANAANEADYIVSVPVIKTHRIAGYSMAMKNSLGMIFPGDRVNELHEKDYVEPDFSNMIAEVNLAVKPDFIVMDGTKAMISGGPFSGEARSPGLVMASQDLIANDVTGLAVLKKLGTTSRIQDISPWEQPQVKRACELKLGITTPSSIEIVDDGVPDIDRIRGFAGLAGVEAIVK